eukprot:PhM_4_TR4690/c0_g1_i1/m.95671/K12586/RRP43, EXOSC8, OIP2; exosome complex component RRP43
MYRSTVQTVQSARTDFAEHVINGNKNNNKTPSSAPFRATINEPRTRTVQSDNNSTNTTANNNNDNTSTTNKSVDQAHVASAVARFGQTTVSCAVSAQCVPPLPHAESEGYFTCNVTAPFCSVDGAAYGTRDAYAALSSRLLTMLTSTSAYPMGQLCIAAGEAVYVLHIDVTVVSDDGCVLDAAVAAANAALSSAKIPQMRVDDGQLAPAARGTFVSFPVTTKALAQHFTFGVVCGGDVDDDVDIDHYGVVVDPTKEETALCLGSVEVSGSVSKGITGVQSRGFVPPAIIRQCLDLAQKRL